MKITKPCEQCSKLITGTKSRFTNRKHIFCSKECRNKFAWLTIPCKQCGKIISYYRGKLKPPIYCSKACEGEGKNLSILINCFLCGKQVPKTPTQIKKSKHNFCSSICATKYSRQFVKQRRKSKSEIWLRDMIKKDFPDIQLEQNTRKVLKCDYEIDIWIPEKQLAIELNGPCHYFNIYGTKIFDQVKQRDVTKHSEILKRGFSLIVVNTSVANSYSKIRKVLEEEYNSIIKPALS